MPRLKIGMPNPRKQIPSGWLRWWVGWLDDGIARKMPLVRTKRVPWNFHMTSATPQRPSVDAGLIAPMPSWPLRCLEQIVPFLDENKGSTRTWGYVQTDWWEPPTVYISSFIWWWQRNRPLSRIRLRLRWESFGPWWVSENDLWGSSANGGSSEFSSLWRSCFIVLETQSQCFHDSAARSQPATYSLMEEWKKPVLDGWSAPNHGKVWWPRRMNWKSRSLVQITGKRNEKKMWVFWHLFISFMFKIDQNIP